MVVILTQILDANRDHVLCKPAVVFTTFNEVRQYCHKEMCACTRTHKSIKSYACVIIFLN